MLHLKIVLFHFVKNARLINSLDCAAVCKQVTFRSNGRRIIYFAKGSGLNIESLGTPMLSCGSLERQFLKIMTSYLSNKNDFLLNSLR